jgi:hypothetical protein
LGDAATDRHVNCAPVDCPSHRFDRLANAPGNLGSSRPIRFRQKYNEFFAAAAAENVQVPRVLTTTLGNAAQNLITDGVAVIIYDAPKVVNVEHNRRERTTETSGTFEFAFANLEQAAPRKTDNRPPAPLPSN